MKTLIFALALISLTPASFAAQVDFLVMDPARVQCRVLTGTEYNSFRCGVFHDGLEVHEGRSTGVVTANGDCVKCTTVLDEAKNSGQKVRMLRGYYGSGIADWHLPHFLSVIESRRCLQ